MVSAKNPALFLGWTWSVLSPRQSMESPSHNYTCHHNQVFQSWSVQIIIPLSGVYLMLLSLSTKICRDMSLHACSVNAALGQCLLLNVLPSNTLPGVCSCLKMCPNHDSLLYLKKSFFVAIHYSPVLVHLLASQPYSYCTFSTASHSKCKNNFHTSY